MRFLGEQRSILKVGIFFLGLSCISSPLRAEVKTSVSADEILFRNSFFTIHYMRKTGVMDVIWNDGHQLHGLSSGAQLEDGRSVTSTGYANHGLVPSKQAMHGGSVRRYTIRSHSPGLPDLSQHIWIDENQPWFSVDAELNSSANTVGTRHFDAAVLQGEDSIQMGESKSLRILHVPFDNDMWFRYNAASVDGLKAGQKFTSNEATAIYDETGRGSLIFGSITHDHWKTAIEAHALNGRVVDLDIFGGISSPTGVRTDTHDTIAHGIVRGEHIVSPRIFIGSFSDWRDGLEAYGAANAAIHPPLRWPAGAPTGWNSWAAYADKIDDKRYLGSAEFVRDKLVPNGFGDGRTVYVNLDAFWSKLDAVQLSDAVAAIKAMHGADGRSFEPGIYWTPFAYWSDDLDTYVEGTNLKYRYRDILLKGPDGSFLPKVDGGRAIDPSHPGAKTRTAYYLQQFQKLGFQYLKLDFLSHGAFEGAHYDPRIQTGIEAYNAGMKQIVDLNQGRMFLSLSIAPLFPSGYGHARRLSCDTKGHISGADQSTEYMLNSLTYGWWAGGNLYITDPDHVVLGEKADQGARTVDEGRSRLLSAVISGGMILDSSRLADDPQGQLLAQEVYNNRRWMEVAKEGKSFRPVEGDTGDKATNIFVRSSTHGVYVSFFNSDEKQAHKVTFPIRRIGHEIPSSFVVTDLSSGTSTRSTGENITIELPPAGSTLLELRWK